MLPQKSTVTGKIFYSSTYQKYSSEAIYQDRKLYANSCKFKFNVYQYPEQFDIGLLLTHGWYHPVTNPLGVSRDHLFSIANAWSIGLDPEIVRHPANCCLVLHTDNQRKATNSFIILSELHSRIKQWDGIL